ncbi:hypothetical protein F2Q68_00017033 [Brassica cretica]|uniref:Uncharacterized protein n=1 Tax=Brassica cretica TaxID=69181 RepID=A0A8S9HF08_BRACR|nr:hypothetical protein F2Q68_00017033 [Brassica cretica]
MLSSKYFPHRFTQDQENTTVTFRCASCLFPQQNYQRTLDNEAVMTVERTAIASPMRADETEDLKSLMVGIITPSKPENTPPIPQLPEFESHAASTWHTV